MKILLGRSHMLNQQIMRSHGNSRALLSLNKHTIVIVHNQQEIFLKSEHVFDFLIYTYNNIPMLSAHNIRQKPDGKV